MSRYAISRRARQDIKGIWQHIAADSRLNANRVVDAIFERINFLASNPGLGENCSYLVSGLRRFTCFSYVIYYTKSRTGIRVTRVIHGAQDIDRIFDRI